MSIKEILKEEIVQEAVLNQHALERVEQRLNSMKIDNDLSYGEEQIITNNLQKILSYEFNPNKSFGILLGTFKPNPESRLYTDTNGWNPNVPFYEIYGQGLDDVVKDSTGDEFWAVVRNNVITTVMLRKKSQREFALNDREDNGGLGVGVVSTNVDNLIAKEEEEKEKLLSKPNKKNNIIRINNTQWVVDGKNEKVYQKNKPNRFVHLDNIFNHFDDKTCEEILSKL